MDSLSKNTYRIYWQHVMRYKLHLAVLVVASILTIVLDVVRPFFFRSLIDTMAGHQPDWLASHVYASVNWLVSWFRDPLPPDPVTYVTYLIYCAAAITFMGQMLWRIIGLTNNFFQPRVMADLLNTCYKYMLDHSYSFFNKAFIGSLVNKIKRFSGSFEAIADQLTFEVGRAFLHCGVVVVAVSLRNGWLGLAMFGWAAFYLTFAWRYSRYKFKYDLETAAQDTQVSAYLADTMTNHSNVKLFASNKREAEAFARVTEKLFRLRRHSWTLGEAGNIVQSFLMILLELGVLYAFIKMWQRSILTSGDFILLHSYIGQILNHLWGVGMGLRRIFEAQANANEQTEMLVLDHEIKDRPEAVPLQVTRGAIEFDSVSFCYAGKTKPVLDNLSFSIRPGERVGLAGPSGAGKSTITRLLLKFIDNQQGTIRIDGQDIKGVMLDSLRSQISYVPQDPILFHRSIRANIAYGKPNATFEEIETAAKAAQCHDFITDLPHGYDTTVGERGVNLSGGERQRIAIAMAILADAPILVLDEATSSLDPESEHLIQAALDNLIDGKTTIVIAHRLSTIRMMHRILVISGSGIAEQGTHQELLELEGGIYQKLWKIQHDWLEKMLHEMGDPIVRAHAA